MLDAPFGEAPGYLGGGRRGRSGGKGGVWTCLGAPFLQQAPWVSFFGTTMPTDRKGSKRWL